MHKDSHKLTNGLGHSASVPQHTQHSSLSSVLASPLFPRYLKLVSRFNHIREENHAIDTLLADTETERDELGQDLWRAVQYIRDLSRAIEFIIQKDGVVGESVLDSLAVAKAFIERYPDVDPPVRCPHCGAECDEGDYQDRNNAEIVHVMQCPQLCWGATQSYKVVSDEH